MKPKNFNRKSVLKQCPTCEKQVPVACKACTCGHDFKKSPNAEEVKARVSNNLPAAMDSVKRRRTERVRRERPDFYNSLEYVSPPVNRRRRNTSCSSGGEEVAKKRQRGRPRHSHTVVKKEEDNSNSSAEKEVDVYSNIPAEKALQYSIILADINRKFGTQNFRP